MVAIISQHLLASELQLTEGQLQRLRLPAGEAEAAMRMGLSSANVQTLADCKHLEVTLQAVRCEHTAADAALQSALQSGDQLLRDAQAQLFVAQDELAAFDSAAVAKARRRRQALQHPALPLPGLPAPPSSAAGPATPAVGQGSYAAAFAASRSPAPPPSSAACRASPPSATTAHAAAHAAASAACHAAAAMSVQSPTGSAGSSPSGSSAPFAPSAAAETELPSPPLFSPPVARGVVHSSLLADHTAAIRAAAASLASATASASHNGAPPAVGAPPRRTPALDELTALLPSGVLPVGVGVADGGGYAGGDLADAAMSVEHTRALASALAAAIEASSGPSAAPTACAYPAPASYSSSAAAAPAEPHRMHMPTASANGYYYPPHGGQGHGGHLNSRAPRLQADADGGGASGRPSGRRTSGAPSCLTRSRSFDSSSCGRSRSSGAFSSASAGAACGRTAAARGTPRPRFVGLGKAPHAEVVSAIALQAAHPQQAPPAGTTLQITRRGPAVKGGGGGDRGEYWRGGLPGGGATQHGDGGYLPAARPTQRAPPMQRGQPPPPPSQVGGGWGRSANGGLAFSCDGGLGNAAGGRAVPNDESACHGAPIDESRDASPVEGVARRWAPPEPQIVFRPASNGHLRLVS